MRCPSVCLTMYPFIRPSVCPSVFFLCRLHSSRTGLCQSSKNVIRKIYTIWLSFTPSSHASAHPSVRPSVRSWLFYVESMDETGIDVNILGVIYISITQTWMSVHPLVRERKHLETKSISWYIEHRNIHFLDVVAMNAHLHVTYAMNATPKNTKRSHYMRERFLYLGCINQSHLQHPCMKTMSRICFVKVVSYVIICITKSLNI